MALEIEKTPKVIKESIRIMTPFAKCEEYLVHMPRFVSKLGELINNSSQNDFSIDQGTAKDVYQHIKHPESFRACLMQLCNASWWAFNQAHNSMTEIYIHTSAAPEYIYNIEMILKEGNEAHIQKKLPEELKNIEKVVDDCMKLSVAIKTRFENVLCFIQELVEVLLKLQCVCGEELIKIKDRLEVTKAEVQKNKNRFKNYQQKIEVMGKELEDVQKSYKEEIDAAEWKWTAMKMIGELSAPRVMAILNEPIQKLEQKAAEDLKRRKEDLEKKTKQFNNLQKEIIKTKKEHAKNVEINRKYEHQDNNLKATITLLVEGFEAMTHLQKQWQNMVHFFQMLSNFVNANKNRIPTKSANNAEEVHETIQASYVTCLVHVISDIYVRLSNQHLMESVSILFKLMTLDKGTPEFQSALDQLQKQCKDAETAIKPLKIDLDEIADEKQLAILPAATPEENNPIKEIHPNIH